MALFAAERRSRPRVRVDSEAVIVQAGVRIACRSRDLSSTGVALICAEPVALGELLQLELFLSRGADWLVIEGIVVRTTPAEGGHMLGIRFHEPEPRATARLMGLVRERVRQSNQPLSRPGASRSPAPARRPELGREPIAENRALRSLFQAALRSVR